MAPTSQSIACSSAAALIGACAGYMICMLSTSAGRSVNDVIVSSSAADGRFLVNRPPDQDIPEVDHPEDGNMEQLHHESSSTAMSTAVMAIVLLLILLTIAFEWIKEKVEETADANMKPILESLFGEMTVLGFVSVFSFIVTKLGFFESLSIKVFGESEREELVEIFEAVHYSLFFVMVFFVLEVLLLVSDAMHAQGLWLEMNRACTDPEYMNTLYRKRSKEINSSFRLKFRRFSSYVSFLPHFQSKTDELMDELLLFSGLREEFILERSVEPPFDPANSINRAPDDFNFGRYLAICLGDCLAQFVEVELPVWFFFMASTVLFYGLVIAVGNDFVTVAWIWAALGWLLLMLHIFLETHVHNILKGFAAEKVSLHSVPFEGSMLLESKSLLPAWCRIDLNDFAEKRSWIAERFGGRTLNRHHAMFIMGRNWPEVQLLVMQASLVFESVYVSLQLIAFLPAMFSQCGTVIFASYVLFSFSPIVCFRLSKGHLVAMLSIVACIGSFRRPDIVTVVIREDKTAMLVRKLLVVYKMYRAAESPSFIDTEDQVPYRLLLDTFELNEISKTFDMFDRNGSGTVAVNDFEAMLAELFVGGSNTTKENLKPLITALDTDGDGTISKEEFLQWYANFHAAENGISMKEHAAFLVSFFDRNGSGGVDAGELKTSLDALNIGFTIEEIGAIQHEMRRGHGHGSGAQTPQEKFESLLKRYYPRGHDRFHDAQQQTKGGRGREIHHPGRRTMMLR